MLRVDAEGWRVHYIEADKILEIQFTRWPFLKLLPARYSFALNSIQPPSDCDSSSGNPPPAPPLARNANPALYAAPARLLSSQFASASVLKQDLR